MRPGLWPNSGTFWGICGCRPWCLPGRPWPIRSRPCARPCPTRLGKLSVMAARARGVPEARLLLKYPARLALNPVVSTIGFDVNRIFSELPIVAVVLGLTELGDLLLKSYLDLDMNVAGAILLLLTVVIVVMNFVSDLPWPGSIRASGWEADMTDIPHTPPRPPRDRRRAPRTPPARALLLGQPVDADLVAVPPSPRGDGRDDRAGGAGRSGSLCRVLRPLRHHRARQQLPLRRAANPDVL